MRSTTLLRQLSDVTSMVVKDIYFEGESLVGEVRPSWRKPRCGHCGEIRPGYDERSEATTWRHLAYGRHPVFFRYCPRRVNCSTCGVVTEKVSWAAHGVGFTYDFEERVAYLATIVDKTAVHRLTGIAWATVGNIIERVVERNQEEDQLDGLVNIGVDEISYRKHHKYLTTVVDHDEARVVWAEEGKSAATLKKFFSALGPERTAKLRHATIDMSHAYKKAITENAPHVTIVFDRFHVQRLASDALDEVRRSLWRELKGTEEGTWIKKTRWPLLKRPWNLHRKGRQKLAAIQENNKPLYRAYLLKEALSKAFDYKQTWRGLRSLREWLSWACRSKLEPFVKLSRTIREHLQGIRAYFKVRLTNGLAEGQHNKVRTITKRAYGFHSAEALKAMVYLCCGNVTLEPPLP